VAPQPQQRDLPCAVVAKLDLLIEESPEVLGSPDGASPITLYSSELESNPRSRVTIE